ncbi:DUF2637 domain-containing protein [Streptomyces sp. NPDC050400]|uniref:DUF2637 domain-containing protein n=1 Tax=Streptomyces sp. NPDC050400 TaxID=3365610 RepID=UPI00379E08C5
MTPAPDTPPPQVTRAHRWLIGVLVAGAVVIAGIGFAGSYTAVRELALAKGFGAFSYVLPIGIDAGICVLLALDLLLTWIRIPFPLLRQTAWLLTAATIAFNGAAAWPDPLGVGMHAVIPILFVVSVEAARHAIGRIADITADKHMEGVRLTRWLLSPVPTFLLWRRMKLWELRSYEAVIKLEQERLVYQARLHSRFGRAWRRKAPVESLMPLRLARYGVPLSDTAPAGLATPAPAGDRMLPTDARTAAPASAQPDPQGTVAASAPASSPWFTAPVHDGPDQTLTPADPLGSDQQARTEHHDSTTAALQFTQHQHGLHGITQPDHKVPSVQQVDPLLAGHTSPTRTNSRSTDMDTMPRTLPEQTPAVTEEEQAELDPDAPWGYRIQYNAPPGTAEPTHHLRNHDAPAVPDTHLLLDEVHWPVRDSFAPQPEPRMDTAPGTSTDTVVRASPVPSRQPRNTIDVTVDHNSRHPSNDQMPPDESPQLTPPDHYFLAYQHYLTTHDGKDPKGAAAFEELSQHLAGHGIHGAKGRPVSPSTLRRYALEQRIYKQWCEQYAELGEPPSPEALLERLVQDGIRAAGRHPTLDDVERAQRLASGFERRHEALRHHQEDNPHP